MLCYLPREIGHSGVFRRPNRKGQHLLRRPAPPRWLVRCHFQSVPLVGPDERVIIGLPDTVWYPDDALLAIDEDLLSFLCFPVEKPEFFDAVAFDRKGLVKKIQVKSKEAESNWIWGAFGMPGKVLHELYELWKEDGRGDEYIGTLVNAWIERGGKATAVCEGEAYVDVGTLNGYREAIKVLAARQLEEYPALRAMV